MRNECVKETINGICLLDSFKNMHKHHIISMDLNSIGVLQSVSTTLGCGNVPRPIVINFYGHLESNRYKKQYVIKCEKTSRGKAAFTFLSILTENMKRKTSLHFMGTKNLQNQKYEHVSRKFRKTC